MNCRGGGCVLVVLFGLGGGSWSTVFGRDIDHFALIFQ